MSVVLCCWSCRCRVSAAASAISKDEPKNDARKSSVATLFPPWTSRYLCFPDWARAVTVCHTVLCVPLAHPRFGLIYPGAGRELPPSLAAHEFWPQYLICLTTSIWRRTRKDPVSWRKVLSVNITKLYVPHHTRNGLFYSWEMCSVCLLSLPLLNAHHCVYNSSHNLYSYTLAKTISVHKCRITTGNYTANTSLQEMYSAWYPATYTFFIL